MISFHFYYTRMGRFVKTKFSKSIKKIQNQSNELSDTIIIFQKFKTNVQIQAARRLLLDDKF